MRRYLLPVVTLVLCSAGAARAQAADSLHVDLRGGNVEVGSRVRLSAPPLTPDPMAGTVVAMTRDSLMLGRGEGRQVAIESRRVQRLELSRGRHRLLWAAAGAGIGFVVGGVAGGYAGGHTGHGSDLEGLGAMAGFVAGSLTGIPLGAAIGAVAAPERWQPVPIPAPRA